MISFTIYQLLGTVGFAALLAAGNVGLWRGIFQFLKRVTPDYSEDGDAFFIDAFFIFGLLSTTVSIILIYFVWEMLG